MNKTELIAEVANKAGLSRKDAEKALGAVVETITEAVVKGCSALAGRPLFCAQMTIKNGYFSE